MTGLEEMQAFITRGQRPPIMELLDIGIAEVGVGHVVFTAVPDRRVYNLMGIVHGGFAATLLDSACGVAASTAAPVPVNCVTLELKVAYHAALTESVGTVRAIGRVLTIGRRVAHTEARLVGPDDRLYATATSTLLLSERQVDLSPAAKPAPRSNEGSEDMDVVIPHQLGRAEARRRIEAGLPKLADHIPGGGSLQSEWTSDHDLKLVISAMGQTIPVGFTIEDERLVGDVTVPAFLKMMTGQVADFVRSSAEKMLAKP